MGQALPKIERILNEEGLGYRIVRTAHPGHATQALKSDAFTMLLKVYRGTHLPGRNIVELHGDRVRIETDVPFPVEADGETLGTTPATFEVIRKAIRVKV